MIPAVKIGNAANKVGCQIASAGREPDPGQPKKGRAHCCVEDRPGHISLRNAIKAKQGFLSSATAWGPHLAK